MRQRIDISDVERATKIRAKYLRALENEEFDLLPGSTFVRSFLRTYGQYLGLDHRRLIEEYRVRHESQEEVEHRPIAPRPQRSDARGRGSRGPSGGALAAAAVLGLLALLLVLGLTGEEDDGEPDQAAETATQETQERTAPEEREEAGGEEGEEEEERERRPRRVRVRISPSVPIYVCWDRGPDTEANELSGLSEPRTLRGRRIRINVGNPSAAISVDGDRLALEGPGPFGFDLRPGRRPRTVPIGERPCQ